MKPSRIYDVLDLTFRARELGNNLCPLFVGPPGVGKSQIVQAYCNERKLPFIDLRAAYLENVDMVGYPSVEKKGGRSVTCFNTPEFWPAEGKGVLLLEEPNRANTSVMNTFMQLLTDRKVHDYKLPDGYIIVACINPETAAHEVNTMDAALRNRFQIFEVEYDKEDFCRYMDKKGWTESIRNFVSSGNWKFITPENMTKNPGAVYVSPRSFAALEAAEKAGVPDSMKQEVFCTILGSGVGRQYYNFAYQDAPVSFFELADKKSRPSALRKLARHSDPSNVQGDKISVTIDDLLTNMAGKGATLEDEVVADILLNLPVEQGTAFMRELGYRLKDPTLHRRLLSVNAKLKKHYSNILAT